MMRSGGTEMENGSSSDNTSGLWMTRSDGSGASSSGGVQIEAVSHSYGDTQVLNDVYLNVAQGEFMTLLGPSGSGKSTLLRIAAGLEAPSRGRVTIGGRDMTRVPPEDREVGLVFQNYALFPHMTVTENVGFPLRMRRMERRAILSKVESLLDVVELSGLGGRRPSELSGGQQQRVALARALVFQPAVLLLDEPFGALDRRLREQLGLAVRRVQRELGVTTIFVTHDQDEAFIMSTRIALMEAGKVLQVDAPRTVYREPATLQAARLIGQLNEFAVTVASYADGILCLQGFGFEFTVPMTHQVTAASAFVCGVRPENIQMSTEPPIGGDVAISARVLAAIHGGSWMRAQLNAGENGTIMATSHSDSAILADGAEVYLSFSPEHAMIFDNATGRRVV